MADYTRTDTSREPFKALATRLLAIPPTQWNYTEIQELAKQALRTPEPQRFRIRILDADGRGWR